tara:strand:+ start:428 stop:568 length:141 start_codon:yes stop_codon:yes gene_type:complete
MKPFIIFIIALCVGVAATIYFAGYRVGYNAGWQTGKTDYDVLETLK